MLTIVIAGVLILLASLTIGLILACCTVSGNISQAEERAKRNNGE